MSIRSVKEGRSLGAPLQQLGRQRRVNLNQVQHFAEVRVQVDVRRHQLGH
jgi:hypothetical protein